MTQKLNNSMNIPGPGIKDIKYALLSAASALALLVGVGCYHATGYDRAALIAEEIPAIGGTRVPGLKSMAGAGDYYIGNDFVGLAVDGTPLSESAGIADAPGGGSIVDVGFISLDTSYRRVPMPCDMLERLTSVVNQDPDISLVFDRFIADNQTDFSTLEMHGQIHDPKHKLTGASWNGEFVKDVSAMTVISLGSLSRVYTIETTITNNSDSNVDIRSIGDFLYQRGGGFRILATVNEDFNGKPLSHWDLNRYDSVPINDPNAVFSHSRWGVDIPQMNFDDPLYSSVRSGPIAFMCTEPGTDTLDCHVSLGLMPLNEDEEQFLIVSDKQDSLNEIRPKFPKRFVAGGLAKNSPLEPDKSITHKRRLFVKGGISCAPDYSVIFYTQNTPNQATGIMNDMLAEMFARKEKKLAMLYFYTEGTGTRTSPLPLELRFERYIGELDPLKEPDSLKNDTEPDHWKLERLEWMEPPESSYSDAYGYYTTPTYTFGVFLRPGTYRIIARNRDDSSILLEGTNSNEEDRPTTATYIVLEEDKTFFLTEQISPERSRIYSDYGSRTSQAQNQFIISTRGNDSPSGFIQPMRFAISGLGDLPDPTKDPINRRFKSITSTFDPTARMPRPPASNYPGPYHFVGGNSAFGVQNVEGIGGISVAPGLYQAYGARGPLSILESFRLDTRPGLGAQTQLVTTFQAPLPEGWIAFDTPGPSQATSGGMLPCEQLSSALAEGVDVVARAELDFQTDANALYSDFTSDLNYAEDFIKAVAFDEAIKPFIVGARTSNLDGYGTATAYFTPVDVNARNGGARPSKGWKLADFLTQAGGEYNVIIRPRKPEEGTFNTQSYASDPDLWWNEKGMLSRGKCNGDFDALEIINAGTIATCGIDRWWTEFKEVRTDWFSLLNRQKPKNFTKAVGFSSGEYSVDTPVGLVRTYLNIGKDTKLSQSLLQEPILNALKSGAAVVSSGPMLDIKVGSAGPGDLALVGLSTVTLDVTLVAPDWLRVDELRIVVNGKVARTIYKPTVTSDVNPFEQSETDSRFYTAKLDVPLNDVPTGKDAWLVVEAGVSLDTTGDYGIEENGTRTPWNIMMKRIYPVAITNPIFLSLTGGEYAPPGL